MQPVYRQNMELNLEDGDQNVNAYLEKHGNIKREIVIRKLEHMLKIYGQIENKSKHCPPVTSQS